MPRVVLTTGWAGLEVSAASRLSVGRDEKVQACCIFGKIRSQLRNWQGIYRKNKVTGPVADEDAHHVVLGLIVGRYSLIALDRLLARIVG